MATIYRFLSTSRLDGMGLGTNMKYPVEVTFINKYQFDVDANSFSEAQDRVAGIPIGELSSQFHVKVVLEEPTTRIYDIKSLEYKLGSIYRPSSGVTVVEHVDGYTDRAYQEKNTDSNA